MENFIDDHRCFVCGIENPQGLKLQFKMAADTLEAETEVRFPEHFQGWAQVVHGGLVSTVLDETMVKAAAAGSINCVTAELTIKFKKPIQPNIAYLVHGKIIENKKRILLAEAVLKDDRKTILASASAKLFVI